MRQAVGEWRGSGQGVTDEPVGWDRDGHARSGVRESHVDDLAVGGEEVDRDPGRDLAPDLVDHPAHLAGRYRAPQAHRKGLGDIGEAARRRVGVKAAEHDEHRGPDRQPEHDRE